jgi:hypothetical protein
MLAYEFAWREGLGRMCLHSVAQEAVLLEPFPMSDLTVLWIWGQCKSWFYVRIRGWEQV